MNKAKSVFQILIKMLRKKRREPTEKEGGKVFHNEGEKAPSYGLNRHLIYIVGGVVVVALVTSLYLSLQAPNKKKREPEFQAADQKVQASLPDDYEEMNRLAKYDGKKQKEKQQRQSAAQEPKADLAERKMPPGEVQRILSSYKKPSAYQAVLSSLSDPMPVENVPKQQAGKKGREPEMDSAIRFTLSAETAGQEEEATKKAERMEKMHSDSDTVLLAGTVIPAVLQTGINSDLKGQVVAQVREDVFDSVTGEAVLIPRGCRLLGKYDGEIEGGQSRLHVVWNRLIFPDGLSLDLGEMASISGAGYAGLKDRVDKHSDQVLGAAALTSALAALGSVAAGDSKADYYTTGQLASRGAVENLLNAAAGLIQKSVDRKPTITIRPGFAFHVFVNQDLTLSPWDGREAYK